MKKTALVISLVVLTLGLFAVPHSQAQTSSPTLPLLAIGRLDHSRAGYFADLSGLTYPLENGVPANSLGGLGSALAYASGDTFLALPDRGPNAVNFNALIDNTVSYINRFHTVTMDLKPNRTGKGLPFTLTPELRQTTLLWSHTPLFYGTGTFKTENLEVGDGAPRLNWRGRYYFTGRSDNFDPSMNSGDSNDARFDTEGMRLSNDGRYVYISDEYGPHVYEFDRFTGERTRSFQLPASLFVANQSPVGADEASGNPSLGIPVNTSGRVDNKGMEGLAITPDGRTLYGIVQNALIQDANANKNAKKLLRIIKMDIRCGCTIGQYGYLLTDGSGVSEIVAVNNHQLLVDERDGNGRESAGDDTEDSNNAVVKKLYMIDLDGATDISGLDTNTMTITQALSAAIPKTIFLDIVQTLTSNGIAASDIPAKIEGVAFGPDIKEEDCTPDIWERLWRGHERKDNFKGRGKTVHTLWIANDNDYLQKVLDPKGNQILNPNQVFVFSFTDDDLPGFVPQNFGNEFHW